MPLPAPEPPESEHTPLEDEDSENSLEATKSPGGSFVTTFPVEPGLSG